MTVPLDQVQKFETRSGLTFWYDPNLRQISTEDPLTGIEFHIGHDVSRMVVSLRFDGKCIVLGESSIHADFSTLVPKVDGIAVWTVGSAGWRAFRNSPDGSIHSYLANGGDPSEISLGTIKGFSSRAEQERAMQLLQDFLNAFDGTWYAARSQDLGPCRLEFTPEFQAQLDSGKLIFDDPANH